MMLAMNKENDLRRGQQAANFETEVNIKSKRGQRMEQAQNKTHLKLHHNKKLF